MNLLFKDRLAELLKENPDKTRAGLTRSLGISRTTPGDWLSGKSGQPSWDNAKGIAKYFGKVRAEWVYDGSLPKFIAEEKVISHRNPSSKPLRSSVNYITFELLSIEASAGHGVVQMEFAEVIREIEVLESWARETLGGDLGRIKLITARGTSMQGTIENGDILFVDSTVRRYDGDAIYIIARAGNVHVKRLQALNGDTLAVISDNRA